MVHGGLDYASKLLVDMFGKDRADDLLMMARRSQEAVACPMFCTRLHVSVAVLKGPVFLNQPES
jgi:hypothetical protein